MKWFLPLVNLISPLGWVWDGSGIWKCTSGCWWICGSIWGLMKGKTHSRSPRRSWYSCPLFKQIFLSCFTSLVMRAAAVRRSVSLRTLSVKTDFRSCFNFNEFCWNWFCNCHTHKTWTYILNNDINHFSYVTYQTLEFFSVSLPDGGASHLGFPLSQLLELQGGWVSSPVPRMQWGLRFPEDRNIG